MEGKSITKYESSTVIGSGSAALSIVEGRWSRETKANDEMA